MPVTYAGRAHWCSVRLAIFAGCLLAVSATRIAETAAQSAQPKPVARVGNETIGEDELTQNLRAQLARLERQRYELLNSRLEQLIDERLLAQEAARRGISVDQLLQSEVLSQIREATDTEVANFIKDNRNNLAEGDAGQVAQRVKDYLHSQRVTDGRAVYVRGLRKKTDVTVYLTEPDSARVSLSASKGFVRGTENAPITIVEFTGVSLLQAARGPRAVDSCARRMSGRRYSVAHLRAVQNVALQARKAVLCGGHRCFLLRPQAGPWQKCA